jgi:hypothetical protein
MKIKLHINQSDYLTSSYISELTNHGRIELNRINYDPEEELANILLVRYPIVSGRNLMQLGEYQRDYENPIQTSIIIKGIQTAEISKSDKCDDIKEITLILGLSIKGKEIYFGSAEEATGEHCYGASFWGDNLILELEDIKEDISTEQNAQPDSQ